MTIEVCDQRDAERLLAERRARGEDRYDEVWDGVYVMAPLANNQHQRLIGALVHALGQIIPEEQGLVYPGVNVSDRPDDWTKNFRCPDTVVYLSGNPAEDRGTHYFGGPDFAVEITSPNDRSRAKFDFYAKVNTRELLIFDRDTWALELYVLRDGKLELAGRSAPDAPAVLTGGVIPVAFRLLPGEPAPRIEVRQTNGDYCRLIKCD